VNRLLLYYVWLACLVLVLAPILWIALKD